MSKLTQAIEILEKLNADDIAVYDFSGRSPFYDYFIVGTVNERASSSAVGYFTKDFKDEIKQIEGKNNTGWLLIDLGDIVVHLFNEESREFYGFDKRFMEIRKK
ncbi:ribosome silencing factor [Acholeplasma granularum]|uniref:ribosome silencing factor n=1 Tax=Acholeplasma granularum TaxID=264635 RepID=UPI00046EC231|nr:ribosome silencing factor [Acholeplasma granularum]